MYTHIKIHQVSSQCSEVTLVATVLLWATLPPRPPSLTTFMAFFPPAAMLVLHVVSQQLRVRARVVALVALVGLEVEVYRVDVVG